jgi:hypothetical protein
MCIESPVAWFFDVARIPMAEADTEVRAPVDPLFVKASEPGSIRVLSTQPDVPLAGMLGAFVNDRNQLVVRCPPGQGTALSVTVTLAGARKDATQRFPVYSEEQANRNQAFWDQAVHGSGKARGLRG